MFFLFRKYDTFKDNVHLLRKNETCSKKGNFCSKYDRWYPGPGKIDPVIPKSPGGTRPNICIDTYEPFIDFKRRYTKSIVVVYI